MLNKVVFCQSGFYSRYKHRWHHLGEAARRRGWDVTYVVPTHIVTIMRHRFAGTSAACRVPARVLNLIVPVPQILQRLSRHLRRWVRASWDRQVGSLAGAFADSAVVIQDPNFPEPVLGWDRALLVHDVIDDYLRMDGPATRERELRFAAESDFVVITAEGLREPFAGAARAVHLVPNGVAAHDYTAISRQPRDEKRAVFMGTLGPWVDSGLLRETAAMAGDWEFLVIGSVRRRVRSSNGWPRNVHFVGRRDYLDLPDYLSRCSVGLVPFNTSDPVAQTADPLKFYEYVAAGLPVVSTPIAPVLRFASQGCVFMADSPAGFVQAMEQARTGRTAVIPEMDDLATQNSWDARWRRFEELFRASGYGRPRGRTGRGGRRR